MSRTLELLAELRAHRAVLDDAYTSRAMGAPVPPEQVAALEQQETAVVQELLGDGADLQHCTARRRPPSGRFLRGSAPSLRRRMWALRPRADWANGGELAFLGVGEQQIGTFTRSALRGETTEIEIDFSRYTQLQPVSYPVLWSILDGI